MNILFLSLAKINSFFDEGIYSDLARELIKNGHVVYYVCASERRNKKKTTLKTDYSNGFLLTVKTLNIQKTNVFEKGLGTLLITNQFKRAIKKHFKGVVFDLILYPTPPITLYGVVTYFKKRDNAKTYLMLKDIFPQNAVDLGLMKKGGIKGLIYRYFRRQEKRLYAVSDRIGCMSPANVEYILKHNREIAKQKVEVFPNCIETKRVLITDDEKEQIRKKYCIPFNKKIFVYGGNLGKPQGIPFILECLKAEKDNKNAFFMIVGDGTEFNNLAKYYQESGQENFLLIKSLPHHDFLKLLTLCDVGMVFLDYRFTIPNFPSRILSYMQANIPILVCSDKSTDIGSVIEENKLGYWCPSNDQIEFSLCVEKFLKNSFDDSFSFLESNYAVDCCVNRILVFLNGDHHENTND